MLRAASAAIEAGGLPNIRARALAEEAGCAVGAIYGVFPDLDALVLAVNAQTLDAVGAALRDAGHHSDPADQLARLAGAYLAYARAHRQRWRALFQHRMAPGRPVPAEYAGRLQAAFTVLDAPLAALRPGMAEGERALLAQTMFSAVHGVVDLGLDEKVAQLTPDVLAAQLDGLVRAMAAGLAAGAAR